MPVLMKAMFLGVVAGLIAGNKLAVCAYYIPMSYSSDSELVRVLREMEKLNGLAELMRRRLTPHQAASVLEEWEAVCEDRGWLAPVSLGPPRG